MRPAGIHLDLALQAIAKKIEGLPSRELRVPKERSSSDPG